MEISDPTIPRRSNKWGEGIGIEPHTFHLFDYLRE